MTARIGTLLALVLACALTAPDAAAQITGTTVLTFPSGTPNPIPQAYGDYVTDPAAGGFGYGGSGGYTPHVAVDYAVAGGAGLQPLWYGSGYGDLMGILWGPFNATVFTMTFTASAGQQVALLSFDVGTWLGTAITIPAINVYDGQGVLVWSQTNVTPPASTTAHLSVALSPAPLDDVLVLEVVLPSSGLYNLGFDNVTIAEVGSAPIGQANGAAASLRVNGVGPIGIGGPWSVTATAGGTLTLDWMGPAGMPCILVAGGPNGAGLPLGCAGILNVGTPPAFADLVVLVDGTQPDFLSSLFRIGAGGTAAQTFTIPAGIGNVSLQGAILQPPGSPCPVRTTAAFDLTVN